MPPSEIEDVIANSKTSAARSYSTDDLTDLARELFNGALPKLSGEGFKRRSQLAREFAAAHLSVPGVSKPDPAKLAALAPAFRAIAASRQARVDAYLAGLVPQPTVGSVRQKLVAVLGERALKANVLRAHHQVALVLTLLDSLDGRDTALDLNLSDSGQKLVTRLDVTFGKAARENLLPRGPGYLTEGLALLTNLAEALADHQAGVVVAAPSAPTRPTAAPKPAGKPAAPPSAETLAAAVRAEADPAKRAALFAQLQAVWNTKN